jgi:hypothetical protein
VKAKCQEVARQVQSGAQERHHSKE